METLLNSITESYSEIIWNIFKQVLLVETREEEFEENFYYWVNTTLTTENLETLYIYVEDKYFQYELPFTKDYEEEWMETSTQKSRYWWYKIHTT